MKKRIIAVNSNCYHGFSIEEAIAGIRDAGFHYIELTATKGWTEHVFPDQSFNILRFIVLAAQLSDDVSIGFLIQQHMQTDIFFFFESLDVFRLIERSCLPCDGF